MMIVDAQVHIWAPDPAERPWPSGRSPAHRSQPFLADDLLKEMEGAGVARVVIVPPSWEGDRNDLALEAARRHPDRFAVMGRLAIEHLPSLLALARHPQVAVKASALPCYSSEPYPFRGLHPYIRRVFDAFGPRRMFWGTDLTRLPCAYRQAVTLFTEELPWLSPSDKEWIMGRGASRWLGWDGVVPSGESPTT